MFPMYISPGYTAVTDTGSHAVPQVFGIQSASAQEHSSLSNVTLPPKTSTSTCAVTYAQVHAEAVMTRTASRRHVIPLRLPAMDSAAAVCGHGRCPRVPVCSAVRDDTAFGVAEDDQACVCGVDCKLRRGPGVAVVGEQQQEHGEVQPIEMPMMAHRDLMPACISVSPHCRTGTRRILR